jgi:hypothetical protein
MWSSTQRVLCDRLQVAGPLAGRRPSGLLDRPSRAHRLPGKTSAALEAQVLALRTARKLVSSLPVVAAVRLLVNHGGFGEIETRR